MPVTKEMATAQRFKAWDLAQQDPMVPNTPERVQRLKAEADSLDRRADHLVSMRGRSPMFKWTDVWRAREQAKKLRAEAVRLVIVDAL